MPKRSSRDINQIAARILEETTGLSLEGKDPIAVALGRRGGRVGGKARAEKLTDEHRKAIAQQAAKARWAKGKKVYNPAAAELKKRG
jgi:hypothetical protein